jgi:hypothetical protein
MVVRVFNWMSSEMHSGAAVPWRVFSGPDFRLSTRARNDGLDAVA